MMALDGRAISAQALALVASILEVHEATLSPQGMQRREERLAGVKLALEAMLCDLIGAAALERWSWRSMRREAFSRQAVSYRMFALVREMLLAAGLVEELPPFTDRTGFGPVGKATRLRLTQAGMALVERHGIDPSDHGQHFALSTDAKAQAMDL